VSRKGTGKGMTNLTITIVKMIIAYVQAQIQRKLQYTAKSAKIDAKKKNC
jgi:hypothetical protein